MQLYQLSDNGKFFTFQVIHNFTDPCPQCGVPACGREDILWYEQDEQRIAIIFDGGYLDLALEEVVNEYFEQMEYAAFPEFIRAANECRGWTDCWDYEGYELDIEDFLASITLLKTAEAEKLITKEVLEAMQKLANTAKAKGISLKIVRG